MVDSEGVDNGEIVNHYAVLGLPDMSSLSSIKTAYRRKALQMHPDKQRQSN